MASLTSLCICLFAKQMQTNCTELTYLLKLSIQMFLCLESATNSSFERQDMTLKAVIISLKYKGHR